MPEYSIIVLRNENVIFSLKHRPGNENQKLSVTSATIYE